MTIPVGREVTIDLGGNELTLNLGNAGGAESNLKGIDVPEGGKLIIKNGTLISNGLEERSAWTISCAKNSKLALENCTVNGSIQSYGDLTAENTNLIAEAEGRAALMMGTNNEDIAWNLTMNGGSIVSKKLSAVNLQCNIMWQGSESGKATLTGVKLEGNASYYDLVIFSVDLNLVNCTLEHDNAWVYAGDQGEYPSKINGKTTNVTNYLGKFSEIEYKE